MNSNHRFATLLLASALVVVMGGCVSTVPANQETPTEYVSDTWITTKVKAALIDDPGVKATEVNVETFKGAVQLSGFVSTNAAMNEAVRLTRGIKGVTSVKNDMRLK